MAKNYQKELEKNLDEFEKTGRRPSLFMQACCAPCSSYCMEYLEKHFDMTMFFYNPNITDADEWKKRENELARLISEMPFENRPDLQAETTAPDVFFEAVKGHENDPERGGRCRICYELRLRRTAELAKNGGYDFFCTTLSISPMKNAEWLNEIGEKLGREYGIAFLCSDFKKKNGYKRSIELSAEYGLYRQDFCGCVFSARERQAKKALTAGLAEDRHGAADAIDSKTGM